MFVSLLRSAQGQCQLDVESGQTDLQSCSKSVNDWLTRGVWSAVAMSAILMAFQVISIYYLSLSIYLSITANTGYDITDATSHDRRNGKLQRLLLPLATPTQQNISGRYPNRRHPGNDL